MLTKVYWSPGKAGLDRTVPDDVVRGSVRAAAHEDINLLTLPVAVQGAVLNQREIDLLPTVKGEKSA